MARRAKLQRLDQLLPWLVSATFHLGLALVAAFVIYLSNNLLTAANEGRTIIVPNSFEDPAYADHAGSLAPGPGNDPLHQNGLKDIARSEGWDQASSSNVAALLGGPNEALGIFAGSGATLTPGQSKDAASAYGTPNAGNAGVAHSTFHGIGGNGARIVYLIDRTGSLDSFGAGDEIAPGTVKFSVQESVNKLVPIQRFSVLVFTGAEDGGTQIVGGVQMALALPENKAIVLNELRKVVAQGGANDEETIFLTAFHKAFALRPDLIFFLTDGNLSPNVAAVVKRENTFNAVINAVMFTSNDVDNMAPWERRKYDVIVDLAKQNGGVVKVIPVGGPH